MFTFAAVVAAAGSAIEGSWGSGEVSWGGSEKEMVRLEEKKMITKALIVLWKHCPFGTNPKLHFPLLFLFTSVAEGRRLEAGMSECLHFTSRVARTSKLWGYFGILN